MALRDWLQQYATFAMSQHRLLYLCLFLEGCKAPSVILYMCILLFDGRRCDGFSASQSYGFNGRVFYDGQAVTLECCRYEFVFKALGNLYARDNRVATDEREGGRDSYPEVHLVVSHHAY